jgi:DNA-binding MarR family transcriptional regulator
MSDETNEILTRIEQLLVALLRAATSQKIAEIREDKTLRLIHSLTGAAGVNEIAKRAKVSTGKVSGIWQSWEEEGLITKEGKSFRKLI